MSIEVLYILGLHAVLIASEGKLKDTAWIHQRFHAYNHVRHNYGVYVQTYTDLVDLEALCSSNRAGAKWTVISPTYNGAIDLDFSCTNVRMYTKHAHFKHPS